MGFSFFGVGVVGFVGGWSLVWGGVVGGGVMGGYFVWGYYSTDLRGFLVDFGEFLIGWRGRVSLGVYSFCG